MGEQAAVGPAHGPRDASGIGTEGVRRGMAHGRPQLDLAATAIVFGVYDDVGEAGRAIGLKRHAFVQDAGVSGETNRCGVIVGSVGEGGGVAGAGEYPTAVDDR